MEQRKVSRLNTLFEKMVSNNANGNERQELNNLYQEYINDGREDIAHKKNHSTFKKVALN